jgi:hypothetical protein
LHLLSHKLFANFVLLVESSNQLSINAFQLHESIKFIFCQIKSKIFLLSICQYLRIYTFVHSPLVIHLFIKQMTYYTPTNGPNTTLLIVETKVDFKKLWTRCGGTYL